MPRFLEPPEDGRYDTGDIVSMDAEGFVTNPVCGDSMGVGSADPTVPSSGVRPANSSC